jgi:muconate cycloisomerase
VEAIPLRTSFQHEFRFGTTNRKKSQNVIVRIMTEDGIAGYGEACPVAAFTTETQRAIVTLVEQLAGDLLVGHDPMQQQLLIGELEPHVTGCPFTLAAIDMALWDVVGKVLDVSASTLLGGRLRDRIPLAGSVGWNDGDVMAAVALAQLEQGYDHLKLYVGRGSLTCDLRRIETVRRTVGPAVKFLIDVNGGWSVRDSVAALPALRDLGVVLVEQPIAASDSLGQQEFLRESDIDVAADEGVFEPADVASVGRLRLAHLVNLGVSKLGGLFHARECAAVARSAGLRVIVGSVLEMGIGTAAGLHLAAAMPDLAYPSYLVGPTKYTQDISSPAFVVTNGSVKVPDGPGLGVVIDTGAIEAMDLRR